MIESALSLHGHDDEKWMLRHFEQAHRYHISHV
jgi:hypothetical protein